MARKKSKAKKPAETMRQRQMRLRREALARKAASRKALPPGKKDGPLAKTTKALPAGKTPKALPPGKAGGALSRAVRGVKGVGPNAAVGQLASRIAVPLGMVSEVSEMRSRSKRDAERNRRLGRKPFQELRDAAKSKGNTKRRGQGSRARTGPTISKTKRPVANLPKDYKKTEAAAFKAAKKPKPSGGGSSTTTTRRAAAPAAPRKAATPKKLTNKQRMVGASSSDRMAAWAKANRKMIEKSGTKAQKAILAKALKPKKATGGKTTIIPNKTKVAFSKGTNLRSDKKKKK